MTFWAPSSRQDSLRSNHSKEQTKNDLPHTQPAQILHHIIRMQWHSYKKWFQDASYFLKPILPPINTIHLIDSHDELSDAKASRNYSMLSGLPTTIKPCFELCSTDNKNSSVRLSSTANHVGNKVPYSKE